MQLSLFDDFNKKESTGNLWKDIYDFVPEVGDVVCINQVIAFSETLNKRAYCYCMRVVILEKGEKTSRVMTTKEWETACKANLKGKDLPKDWPNTYGNIWIIDNNKLAKIF